MQSVAEIASVIPKHAMPAHYLVYFDNNLAGIYPTKE